MWLAAATLASCSGSDDADTAVGPEPSANPAHASTAPSTASSRPAATTAPPPAIPYLAIDTSRCSADWDETAGLTDDTIVIGSHGMWSVGLDRYAGFQAHLDLVNERGGVDGRALVFETHFLAPNDGGMYLRTVASLLEHADPFVV